MLIPSPNEKGGHRPAQGLFPTEALPLMGCQDLLLDLLAGKHTLLRSSMPQQQQICLKKEKMA